MSPTGRSHLTLESPAGAEIISTTFAVGVASLFVLIASAAWIRRRWFPLGPIACVVDVMAVALLLFVIWRPFSFRDSVDYVEIVGSFYFFAAGLTHACLVALAELRREYRWVRRATVMAAAVR